jgi:hypothetical protein
MFQLFFEIILIYRHQFLQRLKISAEQFVAQFVVVLCFCLPEKRSHIVIKRSATTTLKIDKAGFAVADHDIAALKIAVHEGVGMRFKQDIRKQLKIVFEFILLKIKSC